MLVWERIRNFQSSFCDEKFIWKLFFFPFSKWYIVIIGRRKLMWKLLFHYYTQNHNETLIGLHLQYITKSNRKNYNLSIMFHIKLERQLQFNIKIHVQLLYSLQSEHVVLQIHISHSNHFSLPTTDKVLKSYFWFQRLWVAAFALHCYVLKALPSYKTQTC